MYSLFYIIFGLLLSKENDHLISKENKKKNGLIPKDTNPHFILFIMEKIEIKVLQPML